ncbi:MAG: hypothetical protein J6P61_01350 [Erysipelotrichaceae bacterium]|nr:hypothetical protein [Erysipelotrichaceae bacterium]
MDMFSTDYDEQIRQIRITTAFTILDYRFPNHNLAFLYQLSVPQLDEIIARITDITWDELMTYVK